MAEFLPFIPGDTNYRLAVPLEGIEYLFDVRWNERDKAHYFDLRETDETVIALGIKIVLGVRLGRTSTNDFFKKHVLQVVDMSGQGIDAAFDELGTRIQVLHMSMDEFQGRNR